MIQNLVFASSRPTTQKANIFGSHVLWFHGLEQRIKEVISINIPLIDSSFEPFFKKKKAHGHHPCASQFA
jgi:hypothetical protein